MDISLFCNWMLRNVAEWEVRNMPRRRKDGAIYPIKYTTRRRLKDGATRTYEGWHAKVDGRWVSARTYRECNEKIARALKEMNQWGASFDHTVTLGDYTAEWFDAKRREIDPGSIGIYQTIIGNHLSQYARARMSDVTPSMVRRMLANMRNGDGSPASLSRRLTMYSILRQVFQSAVADRLIPTNPVTREVRPRERDRRMSQPDTSRKAFTVEEMRAMLRAASDDVVDGTRQWWRLLTGMRQTEILGVTLDDLDLWERDGRWVGSYTVNWKLEAVSKRHGCGERGRDGAWPCGRKRPRDCPRWEWVVPDGFDMVPLEGQWCLTPPKSHRGKVVPIIPPLAEAVRRYMDATRDWPNPHGLLFRRPDGRPIWTVDDMASFRDLMRRAGIPDPEHRYGHECRHSVVSLLFGLGVDPAVIRLIVGHSSEEMTMHYLHVPVAELLGDVEPMGDRLGLRQIGWKS